MSWRVDPANSRIEFSVQHFRVTTVTGHFESFEGTVDVASIRTGVTPRDDNLRSRAFFHADRYPRLHFRSTRIEVLPDDRFRVYGRLTARDVTREVVFDVTNRGELPARDGQRRWAFAASLVLNRQAFGLRWNPLVEAGGVAVSDEVQGAIEIQFVEV